MFVAKPHKFNTVVELDGSDIQKDVQNLADLDGAALLQAQDFGMWGNPDGAAGKVGAKPPLMGPVPGSGRAENVSGKGKLHPTAKTNAPMSNPFPAPKK